MRRITLDLIVPRDMVEAEDQLIDLLSDSLSSRGCVYEDGQRTQISKSQVKRVLTPNKDQSTIIIIKDPNNEN